MISIKSPTEIKIMREGGKILAGIMKELKKKVEPGVTTKELDRVTETLIFESGAEPAFKGYENFPAVLCTSINQVVVHGVPSDYELKSGDILSLDLGIKYKGFFTDMAITVAVGKVDPGTKKLIKVTEQSLREGIKAIRPGNHIGDISFAIQKYVESCGFKVIRELCGHGIGKELHEDPQILNYGKKHTGPEIKEGMVFCLEPMVTMGDCRPDGRASPLAGQIKKSPDGFGWETKDGSLSAHFEHTIAVTKTGYQILTELK